MNTEINVSLDLLEVFTPKGALPFWIGIKEVTWRTPPAPALLSHNVTSSSQALSLGTSTVHVSTEKKSVLFSGEQKSSSISLKTFKRT